MRNFDVFNGDADGICALHQLRLGRPLDATLVTGMKRDIALLRAVQAREGDVVTVLDISLDRNRDALLALLGCGVEVHYFDHHYAGEVPSHALLHAHLDDSRTTCTSAIVNRHLEGRFAIWAAVGAFGDAFEETAMDIVRPLRLADKQVASLRELGISLNYSAYGQSDADLLVRAIDLYGVVSRYADPFELIDREPIIGRLSRSRAEDLERACAATAFHSSRAGDVWILPDAAWARRVSGTFANRLALLEPHRAHAVLTTLSPGEYLVSVRSAQECAPSAVEFCRPFGGGGRAGAGGIDRLGAARLDEFVAAFAAAWRDRA